ncbi:MAG: hypothetical protein H6581_16375 [Bacteroidia bacterium]|nr:hypothetical protein [Bacteroidia bacterium]
MEVADYDELLLSFFPGEHIFVGDSDFFFGTGARIVCLISCNKDSLFKETLEISGLNDREKSEFGIQIAKKLSVEFDTRTLCEGTWQVGPGENKVILWDKGRSFMVQEPDIESQDLPPGGLRIIKEVYL